jgi:2-polyprenyl-3-methyl-5-hydroxy-6-metoxy-1,4-benzoquinol methylase
MTDIHTAAVQRCILCGEQGVALYSGLRDRLFGAPGTWSLVRCPSARCGLIWLDPMPVREDVHKAYESYYTHVPPPRGGALVRFFAAAKRGYLANHFGYRSGASAANRALGLLPWIYPGRAAELDFSVMWLEARSRGRLLDVGAGSGWLVAHMSSLGWQAEGVDFDPKSVALARSQGLRMHLGSLVEQRFAEASYDAVTMSHSIEHVHDPVAWLAEARRILRPGGRLALATPNTRSLMHRQFREHWFALDPPRHLHLFDRTALEQALRKAGFESFHTFTSIRDANGSFLGSRAIRDLGHHDMTARAPALKSLAARAVQLWEARRLLSDCDAGEDLVALADK